MSKGLLPASVSFIYVLAKYGILTVKLLLQEQKEANGAHGSCKNEKEEKEGLVM